MSAKKINKFRSAYDGSRDRASHQIKFDPAKARTKQEFKDDCDPNRIWADFVKTGRTDQLMKAQGYYADLSIGPQTYHEAMNLLVDVRKSFDALPADIREQFHNDPQEFMEAADRDPEALFQRLRATPRGQSIAPTPPAPPVPEAPVEPDKGPVDGGPQS